VLEDSAPTNDDAQGPNPQDVDVLLDISELEIDKIDLAEPGRHVAMLGAEELRTG
jgi:hypothetical protein